MPFSIHNRLVLFLLFDVIPSVLKRKCCDSQATDRCGGDPSCLFPRHWVHGEDPTAV